MYTTRIEEHVYLIDVATAGIKNFIASYVLKGEQIAIVETGPASSIPNLLFGLKKLHVKPEQIRYVMLSHIHLDHGGGAGTLLKSLPKAKVVVHQRGASHLANPEKLWQQSREVLGSITDMYGKPEPIPEGRIIVAADGMNFDIGNNVSLRVVETLGHASHHLSYFETLSQGVFLGDAAGIYLNEIDVIIPTTPSPFRLDIALESIDKLMRLKPKALYYSHFGKTSRALENLQTYTRQLKLWAEIAKQVQEENDSLQAMNREILENDVAMQKAAVYLKTHAILSQTVFKESARGILDFVREFESFRT